MTSQESVILDDTLSVTSSPLSLSLWTQIASAHLGRPVSLTEFRAWHDEYLRRYPAMLAEATETLEQAG